MSNKGHDVDRINLKDYLVIDPPYPPNSRLCLDPEDIAAAERINKEMEKVSQQAKACFAYSEHLAHHGSLCRSRV